MEPLRDTSKEAYARRLQSKERTWWKRAFNVQAPYQWNLRRQNLGRVLEVGCGIGRNLGTLGRDAVGVDHNEMSVALARQRGLLAMTWPEFEASPLSEPESFDGILVAHVIEHMERSKAEALLVMYLPYLRPGGAVLMICPQERGFASDSTHVQFTTGEELETLARSAGLEPSSWSSFPLPRWLGRLFVYNEFHVRATKPLDSSSNRLSE